MLNFRNRYSLAAAILTSVGTLLLAACTDTPDPTGTNKTSAAADQVYLNAKIYTLSSDTPWQSAMAVRDGAILALGSDDHISQFIGSATKTEDMAGRMLMPGIQDMHLHPMDGGLKFKFECVFGPELSTTEVVAVVSDCAASAPPASWIQGGQWSTAILEQATPPTRQLLDAVSGDHPVFLMDWSVHNAWVNTKALELMGVTSNSPNPTGGEILRDTVSGEPTGILLDNAAYKARDIIPGYTLEQRVGALQFSTEQMLANGVTSFRDAITTDANLKAYQQLDQQGDLKARAKVSIPWKSAWSTNHDEELANIRNHKALAGPHIDASFAKIMLDGVPLTYTSAVLEPYAPSDQYGSNHRGDLMHDAKTLADDVAFLDAQGLTIKIHATGDRAVRVALDAIEHARHTNANSTTQHEISHAEMINSADIPRFAALNVAAEMCPILWYPGPAVDAMRITLGERANFFWPVKDLLESGAEVFYGSDWPAVVPSTNPWLGIEAMVTRADPAGTAPGRLWPEQAIDLASALRVFTINGARAGKQAATTGSLETGKRADFIVLDRNLFEVPIADVSDTKVLRTYVDGELVYTMAPE